MLELDAVSALGQLDEIHQQAPEILGMVDFKEGNRYADFDPKVDKVAKYGIAALVAGGVLGAAAKFGLLKLIWVGILAAKKIRHHRLFGRGGVLQKIVQPEEFESVHAGELISPAATPWGVRPGCVRGDGEWSRRHWRHY